MHIGKNDKNCQYALHIQMLDIDAPKSDTAEAQFFDDKEIADLMNVLENYPDPMWAALFTLELFTSCRPGEVIGLNWSDLEDNVLHIRAGANRIDGKAVRTAQPKTKSSKHPIILPPEVMGSLRKWRSIQSERKLQFGSDWPEESEDAISWTSLPLRLIPNLSLSRPPSISYIIPFKYGAYFVFRNRLQVCHASHGGYIVHHVYAISYGATSLIT